MLYGLMVEDAGTSTTLQDQGRTGFQRYGIPVGGALDQLALAAANTVACNDANTAVLECLCQGPALRVTSRSVRIVVAGASAHLEITSSRGDQRIVPSLESACAFRDDIIRVRQRWPGFTAYLAVEGGFDLPRVFGSHSTFAPARLGGYHGRALRTGDALSIKRPEATARPEFRLSNVDLSPRHVVRVMPGPQFGSFRARDIESMCTEPYAISAKSDRMGMRLDGAKLSHCTSADFASEGIVKGSVQVPGDGRPIVLRADCQTVGGYGKVAVVISADVPLLGRLGPGQKLSFRLCGIQEAREARRAASAEMANWRSRLQSIPPEHDFEPLYSCNLISGVFNAVD